MPGHKSIFLGPGTLQLTEGGKEFRPGDEVTMPDDQRGRLTQAGMRFGAVPDEPKAPEPVPEPPVLEPAEVSVAVKADVSSKAPTAREGK